MQAECAEDSTLLERVNSRHEAQLAHFQSICSKEEQRLQEGRVDSTFTCPLTLQIFRDPVLAPSGQSYERSTITEWLQVGAAACSAK